MFGADDRREGGHGWFLPRFFGECARIGRGHGFGETIAHVVASSLVGGTGEKIALTTGAQGKAHVFTVGAGEFWAVDFFAFKVDAGTIGESNLKIVRYDQGFSSSADDSTVLAEHTYSGGEVAAANNDYLYYEFDPIVLTGGQHGTTYALAFSNAATSVELKAYFDTSDAYADGFLARNFYPDLSGSTRDFNFAMGNSGAVDLSEVVFAADFDASTAISGSVSANASEANLNAGTAVGSWALPDVNPGALISDGGSNNALMFDRVTSGSISNTVNAVFSRGVDLAGGEASCSKWISTPPGRPMASASISCWRMPQGTVHTNARSA